jgi:hypothetical protein
VFDGHDGEAAACYVKEHLLPFILGDASFPTAVEEAVKNAFLELDKKFSEACRLDDIPTGQVSKMFMFSILLSFSPNHGIAQFVIIESVLYFCQHITLY